MKRILLITTGGTIASASTAKGLLPSINGELLVSYLPEMNSVCKLDTAEVCTIDSTDMTKNEWVGIVKKIKESYEAYDGFVISHGTDTLAFTAAALTYMIQNSKKPIVLTGSQRPITFDSTDAKVNLTDSILCAMDEKAKGILVVFNGKIIAGSRAKKTMSVSYHAFSSINYPYLGIIQNGTILWYIEPESTQKQVQFYESMNDKVFLLKLTPCTSAEMLADIFKHNDCVIIESFGSGGIPDRLTNRLIEIMKSEEGKDKLLIIATQVVYEGSHISVYEVGSRLNHKVLFLEAKDMNLETTLAKAMWICGFEGSTFEEKRDRFYTRIAADILN